MQASVCEVDLLRPYGGGGAVVLIVVHQVGSFRFIPFNSPLVFAPADMSSSVFLDQTKASPALTITGLI